MIATNDLIDILPFPALLVSIPDQRCVAASAAYVNLIQQQREQVLGKTIDELGLLNHDRSAADFTRMLLEADGTHWEVPFRVADGGTIYLAITAQPIPMDAQDSVFVTIHDISQQHDAIVRLERYALQAQVLSDLSLELAEAKLDLPKILDQVVYQAASIFDDLCVMRLISDDGQWFECAVVQHPNALKAALFRSLDCQRRSLVRETLFAGATVDELPLFLPHATADDFYRITNSSYTVYLHPVEITGLLIVPMRAQGQVIGVLSAIRKRSNEPYHTDDLAFLQGMADRAALAITNARLYANIQAELTARRAAEERYRTVSALTSDYVYMFTLSPDGVIAGNWMTEAFTRISGYTMEELVHLGGWLTLAHPADMPIVHERNQRLLQGEDDVSEFRIVAHNGAVHWLRAYSRPIWNADHTRIVEIVGAAQDITERHLKEEALHAQALLVDTVSDAIITTDAQFLVTSWNKAAEHIYGWRSAEVLGSDVQLLHTTLLNGVAIDTLFPDLQMHGRWYGEVIQQCKNGATLTILSSVTALRDEAGIFMGTVAINRDITAYKQAEAELAALYASLEQRVIERTAELEQVNKDLRREMIVREQAEAALRESERHYRGVVEDQTELIFRYTLDGVITFANEAFCRAIGRWREEVLGSILPLDMPIEDRVLIAEHLAALTPAVPVTTYEHRAVSPNRTVRWYQRTDRLICDSLGHPMEYQTVAFDITERKKAEDALAQSLRFAESVTAATPDIIFIYDMGSGHVNSTNRALQSILGYDLAEIFAAPSAELLQLVHPDDLLHIADHRLRISTLADDEVINDELRLRTHEGGWRWFNIRAVIFQRRDDVFAHLVLGIASDITHYKAIEEALRKANEDLSLANVNLARAARLKDEFLANMSHELRTPLNAILGRAEILLEQLHGPLNERQLRAVRSIDESGNHLLELIGDILDLSKIEAGKLELQLSRLSVLDVCRSSLQMVQQSALKKNLVIGSNIDPQLGVIIGDERRIKQILVNLLTNAVKFTPEGGEIGIEVIGDAEARQISFLVWDTGIGIVLSDMERLFKPFVQLDSSLSRQYSGTGLGLALVARLADMHGGSVSLDSTPGIGSRFTIKIPWITSESAAERRVTPLAVQVTSADESALPDSAPLILLAEDNDGNIELMQDYLVTRGYRLVVAHNGIEAIERAQREKPTIILMDIQMPQMDGITAITQIRTLPALHHVPIIALTALVMPGDRERCMAVGANAYLSKPVSLVYLNEIIQELLA